jgi:hypothetical protein
MYDTLDSALTYAERGWPVLPLHGMVDGRCTCGSAKCEHPGKHPLTDHGSLDATTNTDQITAWWLKWPDANVGIATGPAELAVVDVDPRSGGNEQLPALNLSATLTVRSGSGGTHHYYAGHVKSGILAKGVHLKSATGYVVAPPSLHASGNRYAWVNETPIALYSQATSNGHKPIQPMAGVLPDTFVHGENQHYMLVSAAGTMRRRGMMLDEIDAALQVMNLQRCEVPGPPENIRKIAESICQYAPNDERLYGAGLARNIIEPDRERYVVHAFSEVFEEETPIPWVVEGFFSQGSVSLLFGKPGSKKTYLTMDAALHVALGLDWLGHHVEQGPVLFIDEESGLRRLKRRWRELARCHGVTEDQELPVYFTSLEQFTLGSGTDDILALEQIINQVQPALIIVDALVDITGGSDENDARQMHRVMQDLRYLADRHSVAIAVIHHSGKAGAYRGSSAILGAVDLGLEIVSEKDSTTVDGKSEKTRDTEHSPLRQRSSTTA